MASFLGNRGFGSSIFRPIVLIASICLLMFLLYAYSSTNSELKQHKDRGDRLAKQQEMLKTQVKDLLDARSKLEKDLQKMETEQSKCIRDTDQLKKTYTSQIESMKETLRFRISSLENENSELQSRAGSYEEKYNELTASRKKDQDLYASAQQKCHETTQKLEAQNAELNVQMSDMQRNLDTFRLDRLRSESLRQNCSNQLALSRMKFGQLQEEFQQMTTKLKAMGNAFNDNPPGVQDKRAPVNEGSKSPPSQTHVVRDVKDDHLVNPSDAKSNHMVNRDDVKSSHMAKQDVLNSLQKKLAHGEQLQDSEQLLYQALARETGKVSDLQHPDQKQADPNTPAWFNKLPAEHKQLMSKETQDMLVKPGNNIPAPPFMDEYKYNQRQQKQQQEHLKQQQQQHLQNDLLSKLNLDDKLHLDDKHAATDDQKTFEQDQRDEEKRLFEMFQGDNNHDFKDEDLKDDGDERLLQNKQLYNNGKEEEDEDDEDEDEDYKEKDDNYVYGAQDRKINPDIQNNGALI